MKMNLFNNIHNHPLTLSLMIQEMAPQFHKLTKEMLTDVKKYVIKGHMDSMSIYPLLRYDYPNQPIYKRNLYNVVYQFRQNIIRRRGCFSNVSITNGLEGFGVTLDYKDSIRSSFKKINLPFMDVSHTKRVIQQIQ